MGNKLSKPASLQILKIKSDTPAHEHKLLPFLHFITHINNKPIQTRSDIKRMLSLWGEQDLCLKVTDPRIEDHSQEFIIPKQKESQVLGMSVKFHEEDPFIFSLCVTEIKQDSPAMKAGLISTQDYIIGVENVYILNNDDFLNHLFKNIGNTVVLIVFNLGMQSLRRVSVIPEEDQLLGCELNSGILYNLPEGEVFFDFECDTTRKGLYLQSQYELSHIQNNTDKKVSSEDLIVDEQKEHVLLEKTVNNLENEYKEISKNENSLNEEEENNKNVADGLQADEQKEYVMLENTVNNLENEYKEISKNENSENDEEENNNKNVADAKKADVEIKTVNIENENVIDKNIFTDIKANERIPIIDDEDNINLNEKIEINDNILPKGCYNTIEEQKINEPQNNLHIGMNVECGAKKEFNATDFTDNSNEISCNKNNLNEEEKNSELKDSNVIYDCNLKEQELSAQEKSNLFINNIENLPKDDLEVKNEQPLLENDVNKDHKTDKGINEIENNPTNILVSQKSLLDQFTENENGDSDFLFGQTHDNSKLDKSNQQINDELGNKQFFQENTTDNSIIIEKNGELNLKNSDTTYYNNDSDLSVKSYHEKIEKNKYLTSKNDNSHLCATKYNQDVAEDISSIKPDNIARSSNSNLYAEAYDHDLYKNKISSKVENISLENALNTSKNDNAYKSDAVSTNSNSYLYAAGYNSPLDNSNNINSVYQNQSDKPKTDSPYMPSSNNLSNYEGNHSVESGFNIGDFLKGSTNDFSFDDVLNSQNTAGFQFEESVANINQPSQKINLQGFGSEEKEIEQPMNKKQTSSDPGSSSNEGGGFSPYI